MDATRAINEKNQREHWARLMDMEGSSDKAFFALRNQIAEQTRQTPYASINSNYLAIHLHMLIEQRMPPSEFAAHVRTIYGHIESDFMVRHADGRRDTCFIAHTFARLFDERAVDDFEKTFPSDGGKQTTSDMWSDLAATFVTHPAGGERHTLTIDQSTLPYLRILADEANDVVAGGILDDYALIHLTWRVNREGRQQMLSLFAANPHFRTAGYFESIMRSFTDFAYDMTADERHAEIAMFQTSFKDFDRRFVEFLIAPCQPHRQGVAAKCGVHCDVGIQQFTDVYDRDLFRARAQELLNPTWTRIENGLINASAQLPSVSEEDRQFLDAAMSGLFISMDSFVDVDCLMKGIDPAKSWFANLWGAAFLIHLGQPLPPDSDKIGAIEKVLDTVHEVCDRVRREMKTTGHVAWLNIFHDLAPDRPKVIALRSYLEAAKLKGRCQEPPPHGFTSCRKNATP